MNFRGNLNLLISKVTIDSAEEEGEEEIVDPNAHLKFCCLDIGYTFWKCLKNNISHD